MREDLGVHGLCGPALCGLEGVGMLDDYIICSKIGIKKLKYIKDLVLVTCHGKSYFDWADVG